MRRLAVLALTIAGGLAAVPGTALAANASVRVGDNRALTPATVTIAPDDSVTWTWVGPDVDHSLVSTAGAPEPFDSDPVLRAPDRDVGETFVRTFTRSGSYGYVCRVHDRMVGTVIVTGAPVARMAVSPASPFTDQEATFSAAASTDSDGTIARHEWDLDGNGTFELDTGAVATAARAYAAPGTVTARLRVTDDRGNQAQTQLAVAVRSRAPVASYTVAPATVPKLQGVTFDASASSDPDGAGVAQYAWDLDGDGSFETTTATPTTSRSYAAAGAVTTRLRVTDADGLTSAVVTRVVTVTNQAPVAGLAATPLTAPTGTTVTLDASASADPDGTLAAYRWDLDGNGTFETAASTSPTTTTSLPRAGSRTVRVQVTDDEGATAQAAVVLTATNRAPTAAFTSTTSQTASGTAVALDASASSDPEGTALSHAWDLDGDGTFETSTGAAPSASRVFAVAGTRTIRLRVTDADGGVAEVAHTVVVQGAPPPPPPPPAPPADDPPPATPGAGPAAASPAAPAPAAAAAPVAPAQPAAAPSRGQALTLSAPAGQRARRGRVTVRVGCASACVVRAQGALTGRGLRRALRLAAVRRGLPSGGGEVTLRVSGADAAALHRVRGAVTATVTVTVAGGGAQRVRVRLRP